MSHLDKGHYAKKHASDRSVDKKLSDAIMDRSLDRTITCASAFQISEELNVDISEVGVGIDLLEVSLAKCQLGLFGYGKQRSIVRPSDSLAPGLKESIRSLLVEGRLSCESAWDIANRHGLRKLGIANAWEKLGIKISGCQLGAF